jgi:uncharacterized protein (DUF58 family)
MSASTRKPSDAAIDYRAYLDPKVLAKIGGLELRARMIVEGFFAGMHHSPFHGLSAEFADHRVYAQGDDIRHIDWKLFGKTDKHYIKEYEQETNLNLMVVVDCSESMGFRSEGAPLSKHAYAISVAAAIAYLALQQHDSVGLALLDEHLTHFHRPSNSPHHWKTLVHELERASGTGRTALGRAFAELAERLTVRTLIIIISDLFDDVESTLRGLKHLRYRKHEPVVINVLDPAELSFRFHGPTMFQGLEATGRLLAEPGALRARYLEELERFQGAYRLGCSRMNIDYGVFDTGAPLDAALSTYLATRSARIRQRSSRVMRG